MQTLRTLLILILVSWACPAVSEISDLALLSEARLEASGKPTSVPVYRVPLGKVKLDRDLGQHLPEKSLSTAGTLSFQLWRLSSSTSIETAAEVLRVYFAQHQMEELYHCEARACGESFLWANQIFDHAELYGNDRTQHLWSFMQQGGGAYSVIYLIERPNRRRYLYHAEILVTADGNNIVNPAGKRDLEQLAKLGFLILGPVTGGSNSPNFSEPLQRLQSFELADHLVVVLHNHGPMTETQLMTQLKQQLEAGGYPAYELRYVGALAPRSDAESLAWLELVNLQWKP